MAMFGERYNHLNEYLKNKFGERTLKIPIDAGFSCPNRDGTCGTSGCIFCGERGSGEHIRGNANSSDTNATICNSIKSQVTNFLASYRATRANKFIAYFQNFSNTYASIDTLKSRYDAALIDDRIVALSVATRPDCINEDVVKLLKSYTDRYAVFVELGFQTSNDQTAKLINRGYSSDVFLSAVELLAQNNIEVVAHVMVGLPGETLTDVLNTVEFLNKTRISGVKIHSTYVIKNTKLAEMLEKHEYVPLTLDEYIEAATSIIANLRPDIIIHRISGDAPKDLLLAPDWNLHKKWIINGIEKKLREENIWQGKANHADFRQIM